MPIVGLRSLFRTYARICSPERRQSYKQDFNREYSEYRDLHARIDSVTRQFMELDTQLKQLHHGSHKYKVRTSTTDGGQRVPVKSVNERVDEVLLFTLLLLRLLLRLSCPFRPVKSLVKNVLLFSDSVLFFLFFRRFVIKLYKSTARLKRYKAPSQRMM